MSLSLLLEMATSADPNRTAVVSDDLRLTTGELNALADGGAGVVSAAGAQTVVYVGAGGAMLPLLIFSAARAALPFCPLNYRLSAAGLRELVGRLTEPVIVADREYVDILAGAGRRIIESTEFLAAAGNTAATTAFADPDGVGVILFTSGTSAQPKAVELTHTNLTSYVMGTVDFGAAEPDDAALVCVPPYHIAGVGAALSNLYAGRKTVYLRHFDPCEWVRLVAEEGITTATVVPTMLDRIITELEREPIALPTLKNLAYGGSKVPLPLVRKTIDLLPGVGLVNAYGLTETSSTISVLTPEDHVTAFEASDPHIARRLGSVGRAVPGVEIEIRGADGHVLGPDEVGELFVRGEQVSGRYTGIGSVLDPDGWFATRDTASVDTHGYLYIGGRSDDTIIRGGENIAPAEIEDVLVEHGAVHQVAVVGLEDAEWGQLLVAVVVPEVGSSPDGEELRQYVRARLRGSRTPDRVVFVSGLPTTPTGKILRRVIVEQLELTPAE
ncbi:AMP-dependent synthetase [Mycolicibacterium duvalii]|uniref:AMP-dependent ligase n=1 Tax=Mycolicibacterium duvalii TaxID=39688 RepID=A0A7I7JY57_9MYCO|nr:fatty acid--CoA ligase family protein [Mycolicibacterium duvalii]MCV7369401.1 long-chain fatty acid--CoA ligase [Mycolicibacterium duvalii]PEG40548.1 AMP-dependent synthetase [Mycolicibacterium duvalii]BBX16121.1 AMP-dependent ligase [Mycolicibacterium duvalii]